MAKCNKCLHKYVCEMRTCAECVGGNCDECQLYDIDNGKPDIEKCEYFINEEKPFNVVRCKDCKFCEHILDEFCKDWYQCKRRGNFAQKKADDYCSYGKWRDSNG